MLLLIVGATPPKLNTYVGKFYGDASGTSNSPSAGGGSQVWTNDGTFTKITNGLAIRNSDGGLGNVNSFALNPPPANTVPILRNYVYPERGDEVNYSLDLGSQIGTNAGIYSTFQVKGGGTGAAGLTQIMEMFLSGWTNNAYADISLSADVPGVDPMVQLTLLAGNDPNDDIVLRSGIGTAQIDLGNTFTVFADGRIWGLRLQVTGTTNQVIFGATNSAPVSAAAPTKWVSVQVTGEPTKIYRIPLYE